MSRSLRRFSLCLILGPAVPLLAQPTLTTGQFSYQVGDVFNFLGCGVAFVPQSGANVTWYYNTLSCFASGTVNIVDPASTTGAPFYPAATAADQYPGMQDALYYASTATEELYLGYYTQSGDLGYCSNPATNMVYPFTYGTTSTDTLLCDEQSAYDRIRSGTVTITCVGYGTLLLPYGTFTDVLLVQKTWNYTDIYTMIPDPGYVVGEAYHFIEQGTPIPLLISSTSSYTQAGQTITSQGSSMLDELSTGVQNAANATAGLTLLPNPTNGEVTLHRTSTGAAEIAVIAADGRIVTTARLSTGELEYRFSLANAASGVYVVRITDANGSNGLRLVKD